MTEAIAPYRVQAYNTAKQSENKMHDDTVARRFGFAGGLVPGVDVMAYMMHIPVRVWGRDFLERGFIEARFLKPVYDGETATVFGERAGEGLVLHVDSRGDACATGSASLPALAPALALADYPATAPAAMRKPVDADSYGLNAWIGTAPRAWSGDQLKDYLGDVREQGAIFEREGLIHPGILQRIMNLALVENAILGPWIHVGSRMQMISAAHVGESLAARAKVIANYEKKGHRFVELDAVIVADDTRIVAHCFHIAITQPREQAAA